MSALDAGVLVLNKNWQALRIVDARRALSLLFAGVAEAIDVDQGVYNTYDFESWEEISALKAEFEPEKYTWVQRVADAVAVPAIIRLLTFDKVKRHRIRFSRRNIYARDNCTCQYCGRKRKMQDLNLDHIVPRCQGGLSSWDNIVCSCIDCNSRKAGRTPEQAGMKLIRQPQVPTMPLTLTRVRHDSWKHFVDAAYWNVELVD